MSHTCTIRSLAVVMLGVTACVPPPDDRTQRYPGDLPACEPVVRGDAQDAVRSEPGELWNPGPYPVWNTHPGGGCNENEVMPLAGSRTVTAITGDDYELEFRDLQLYVTYPSQTEPTVTGAADLADGAFGLIVFAHANNDSVCQIFESYYSLHDHWASWGWVVASVDGTAHNCDRGNRTNIELRADGMVAAVDHMRELNEDPDSRFAGKIDFDRVVLAGHSRGGGAAFEAARRVDGVLGIISLQGIDPVAFGFGGRATSLPTLGITAGNDVDLNYPRVEPIEDRLGGPYSWVNITGGIHAYTADVVPLEFDDRPGITRQNQHDVTELFTTAFLHSISADAAHDDVLYSLAGVRAAREVSPYGAYQRWRTANAEVSIDSYDRADPTTNELGGRSTFEGFERAEEVFTYQPDSASEAGRFGASRSLLLQSLAPATYRTEVGEVDCSATPVLQFRVKGPDFGVVAPTMTVRLEHTQGIDEVAIGEAHLGPMPLSNRFQQVVVPLPNPDITLQAIELEIPGGTLFVDDLRFTTPTP